MGLFDFLKDKISMTPGATIDGGQFGTLQQAPTITQTPGLWSRLKTPDANGMNFADRWQQAAMMLDGDTEGAMRYRKSFEDRVQRQRKNEAMRGAYDPQTGKFDIGRYMEAIGPDGDASDAFEIAKSTAPKGGVDGGYAYKIDPMTGEIHWGGQRGKSYREELDEQKAEELEAYREQMIRQGWARVGQGDERIGISRQREGRIAAGGAGGGASAPSRAAGARRIGSQQEYAALPSGAIFIAPDGSTRRKP